MTTGPRKEKNKRHLKAGKAIEKLEPKAPLSERMIKRGAREGKQIKVLRRIFGKQPLRNVVTTTKGFFQKSQDVLH